MKLNYCFTTKVSTDAISDWSECLRKMRLVRDEAIRGQHTEEDYREFIQKAIFDAVMMRGETEMAFWEFDDPNTMPADARCDFVYLPTYLMVQMMVCGVNRHPRLLETSEVRSILEKGLNACAGRDLRGSGYDAMSILIENLKMFIDAGIVEFLADHSDVSPVFGKLFATCIAQLRKDQQTGSCVHDWNHNYSDEMYSVLELYKKHLTSKAPNVDECAHKEWIEAHLEDLQWILGMAHTGIRNTPCAGDHPANLLLHMLDCE